MNARTACALSMIPATLATPFGVLAGGSPATVWRVDAGRFGDEERLAAVCLQGLANRGGMRVFLDYGPSLRWNQIEYDRDGGERGGRIWSEEDAARFRDRYATVCDYWMDALSEHGVARFETVGMEELLRRLRPELRGVILYGSVAEDLAVAATLAGVRDAVPLTEELFGQWVATAGLDLPVVFDVRTLHDAYPSGADRRLEAHRWMLANVFPDCEKSGAVSRDRTYGLAEHDTLVDVDLAVCLRWATFDLSFMSTESRSGGTQDHPHPDWGFDPPDKPLLVELLEGLDDWAPVYGWGRPYESALVRRLALHRCVKVCSGTGNGSFFRQMPVPKGGFRQTRPPAGSSAVEEKCHVTFMVNEGDTLKCAASLMNGGAWLQSERGKIPINWGIDPLLVRDTPGLMAYYARTATTNDFFFAAPSGWGYLAPAMLPDADIPPYGEKVRRGGELADVRHIDIWWMSGLRKRDQFFTFLKATGMRGLTQWSNRQEVEFAPDGTPVIHSNFYYPRMRPEAFAATLARVRAETSGPWFVVVYGGTPHWFHEVARRLPRADFKVVALDEFFEAARAARERVEGRAWHPPKDAPAEQVP